MATAIQADAIHSKETPALIAKLLAKRQETLVLFNRLAALKPDSERGVVQPLLQQFCQALVDYVALWHFEVYECLERNAGNTACCRRVKQLAREFYPQISQTTQIAIGFNDQHEGDQSYNQKLEALRAELSQLGEYLATRIDLEDRLISVIQSPALAVAQ